MARGVKCLRSYVAAVCAGRSPEDTALQTQEELVRMTTLCQRHEAHRYPSRVRIPRFHCMSCEASSPSMCAGNEVQLLHHAIQREIIMSARSLQRKQMLSLVLGVAEIEQLWLLLCEHASPPLVQIDERINYDDFSRVAEAMSHIAGLTFFPASHYLKFPLDGYDTSPTHRNWHQRTVRAFSILYRVGRISIVHFFHWVRAKNAMMRTRVELAYHDAAGDGSLTERGTHELNHSPLNAFIAAPSNTMCVCVLIMVLTRANSN